jgi:phage recombination protein Bet
MTNARQFNAPARRDDAAAPEHRLPMPTDVSTRSLDGAKWRVLCDVIFPSARTAEAIVMAVDYCRARGLDVFKKPVHIVPMWSSSLKREVETVWPGISEIQTTAVRTREWAGMDSPMWGPDVTVTLTGRVRGRNGDEDRSVTITYPEWCEVTVYRLIAGMRCAFSEPVYWREAYSTAGGRGSELPTEMWMKRPRGQLHKVAKAAALRAAFPEETDYTAEEMAGKTIDVGGVPIDDEPVQRAPAAPTPRTLADVAKARPKATAPDRENAVDVDPDTGEVMPNGEAPTDDELFETSAPTEYPTAVRAALDANKFKPWLDWLDGVLANLDASQRRDFVRGDLMRPMEGVVVARGAAYEALKRVLGRHDVADVLPAD